MSDDYKKRVQSAINKYIEKNEPAEYSPSRKNDAPEKRVVKDIMKWLTENEFSCQVFESKAQYDPQLQRYIAQATYVGTADIVGNDKMGLAVYVEAKAPGSRNRLREHQREFLQMKIQTNAFAVCIDSVVLLSEFYTKWSTMRSMSSLRAAREYLLSNLPKQALKDEEPLFEE